MIGKVVQAGIFELFENQTNNATNQSTINCKKPGIENCRNLAGFLFYLLFVLMDIFGIKHSNEKPIDFYSPILQSACDDDGKNNVD